MPFFVMAPVLVDVPIFTPLAVASLFKLMAAPVAVKPKLNVPKPLHVLAPAAV